MSNIKSPPTKPPVQHLRKASSYNEPSQYDNGPPAMASSGKNYKDMYERAGDDDNPFASKKPAVQNSPVGGGAKANDIYSMAREDDNPFASKKPAVQNSPVGGGAKASNFSHAAAMPSEYPQEQPQDMMDGGGPSNLIQCPTCGRKFNEKALEKHQKICVKVFQTKRKKFDMAEQRKATDASGKGIEEDGFGGGGGFPGARGKSSNYKPKMPARQSASQAGAGSAAKGKIPKWKL